MLSKAKSLLSQVVDHHSPSLPVVDELKIASTSVQEDASAQQSHNNSPVIVKALLVFQCVLDECPAEVRGHYEE